ncbi:hypothetical protein [Halarcobacter sp.]|uniref:hypothetical protein n=1 Tax=Halarcobacter sp. TaxID=2321133 RepID=UPI0029F50D1E|nr:hypothetical protein [Halarcobacter sp.]
MTKKINNKKWAFLLIFVSLLVLFLVILFNYIIDPFQQYRKATLYTFLDDKPRYLNAGLAKNYDYDSVLIGSSMVENFYAKDIENYLGFNKVLKLATRGGKIHEEVKTLETAISNNKKLKNILFGLDIYAFSFLSQPVEKNKDFPEYLYDDNFFNDFTYLLNFNVLKNSYKSLLNPYDKNKVSDNLNKLYSWQEEYNMSFTKKNYNTQLQFAYLKTNKKVSKNLYSLDVLKDRFDNVFLPLIQNNTDKNFYLFFPPYSIGQFKIMEMSDYLSIHLDFKKYIFNRLKNYNNIKIFDFQIEKDITHNLSNYKDLTHYSEKINLLMLKQMSKNNYLLKEENIDKFLNTLKEQTLAFDIKSVLDGK